MRRLLISRNLRLERYTFSERSQERDAYVSSRAELTIERAEIAERVFPFINGSLMSKFIHVMIGRGWVLLLLLAAELPVGFAQMHLSDVRVHDPVMAKHDGKYYIFATGRGVAVWTSTDLVTWTRLKPVFDAPPSWTTSAHPSFKGHFWAPDISYHEGQYYLYYSVSAFGRNTSSIGVATNVTLNPSDPEFEWVDRGKVLQSVPGVTPWNAIDPNLVEDDQGRAYLVFGSFWEGLKIAKLSLDRTAIAEETVNLKTIASRGTKENAIEAPFIFKKNGWYYLFASIDFCCRGAESTYKMIVGRSRDVLGPYLDDKGIDLVQAGGKLLLAGDSRWHGVGHNAVYEIDGDDYLVFHGYDAHDNGIAKLRIEKLSWDDAGWPMVAEDLSR